MFNNIEDKGVFKIEQNNQDATMHYVASDGKYYALTLGTSEKITHYLDNENIFLVFMKKPQEKINGKIKILRDSELVLELFNKMKELKSCYFKEFTDDLVILEIHL